MGLGKASFFKLSFSSGFCVAKGPELLTVGPYRPISLVKYTARISDFYPRAVVSGSLVPSLSIDLAVRGASKSVSNVNIVLRTLSGIVKEQTINSSQLFPQADALAELISWSFKKHEVRLWWPTGYGTQQLYEVEVTLLGEVCFQNLDLISALAELCPRTLSF